MDPRNLPIEFHQDLAFLKSLPRGSYRERYEKELNARLEALEVNQEPEQTQRTFSAEEMSLMPPVSWLIPGYIPKSGLTQLTAASGAGKSFVALDWAIQVASEDKHVLYVVGEGWQGMGGRLRGWKFANPTLTLPTAEHLTFCPPVTTPDLVDRESVDSFIAEHQDSLAGMRFDLIIFDTLARAMTGNESDNEVMGTAVKACSRIQQELGGAVVLVHHFGWEGTHQRGGSALYGACDSVVYMQVQDKDEQISKVWAEKTKDGRKGDVFYVQMYAPNPANKQDGTIRRVPAPDKQGEFELRVIDALECYGPIKQTELRAILSCKNDRLVKTLKDMEKDHMVIQSTGSYNSKVWDIAPGNS